jgi:hypothetical protein
MFSFTHIPNQNEFSFYIRPFPCERLENSVAEADLRQIYMELNYTMRGSGFYFCAGILESGALILNT